MALTLIPHRVWTPERIARHPRKVRGGWVFTHPSNDLWRYNRYARRQAAREWAMYGAAALASIVGGAMMGLPPLPLVLGTLADDFMGAGPLPNWPGWFSGLPSFGTSVQLDAAGEYFGMVFRAPKTGNLDQIGVSVSAAIANPTGNFTLETVDGATGLPSGTLLGATNNAKKNGVAMATNWTDSGALDEVAAVTRGQLVAAKIAYASGTSFNCRVASGPPRGGAYEVEFTGGAGSRAANKHPAIAVRYDDGAYYLIPGSYPFITATSESFSSGSNPNHRGTVYTAQIPRRCIGAWYHHASAASADFDLIVATDAWDGTVDNDGTSNLAGAIDKDWWPTATMLYFLSTNSLALSAGSEYRSLLKPGAANAPLAIATVNAAAILGQTPGGVSYRYTTAQNPTGASDWTETDTKIAWTGWWVDQHDDGAGGGASGSGYSRGRVVNA